MIICSSTCHPRCSCLSFFSHKEIKFLEENLPGFFSIYHTSMVANDVKVKNAVSMQLERALHDLNILDDMGVSNLSGDFYSGS